MRSIYYAHCLALYGTKQETRDGRLLNDLGFNVVSPSDPEVGAKCDAIRAAYARGVTTPVGPGAHYTDASSAIMSTIFKPMVQRCDALAFRSLPGGAIPKGVASEIEWAREKEMPIIELPSFALRPILTVEETRTYLREVGQR